MCVFQSDPADQDVIIRPYSEHCSSINMELWLTAVYGYKGPLLVSTDTVKHQSDSASVFYVFIVKKSSLDPFRKFWHIQLLICSVLVLVRWVRVSESMVLTFRKM